MIEGLSSSFSGQKMLEQMGINSGSGVVIEQRGNGNDGVGASDIPTPGGKRTLSSSGLVGNSSGGDIKNATLLDAENTKNQLMIEAKEAESTSSVDAVNTTVVKIYELLEGVTRGSQTLRVRVDSYGLTDNNISGLVTNENSLNAGKNNTNVGSANNEVQGSSFSNSAINGDMNLGTIGLGGWTIL
jgi:hypothetical protein